VHDAKQTLSKAPANLKDLYSLLSSTLILEHLDEKYSFTCSNLESYSLKDKKTLEETFILGELKSFHSSCSLPAFEASREKLIKEYIINPENFETDDLHEMVKTLFQLSKIYAAKTIQKSDLTQFLKTFEQNFSKFKVNIGDDLRIDLGNKQKELTTSAA